MSLAHPFTPDEAEAEIAHARAARWPSITHEEFKDATLDVLDPDVRNAVERWLASPPGTNLLFVGRKGRGKTFAAWAVLHHLYMHGTGVLARSMIELLDEIKAGFKSPEPSTIMQRVCTVDVFLLDDLGAQSDTQFAAERITALMDARWRDKRATIITTNLSYEDVVDRIDERIADRVFAGNVVIVPMDGPNRRRPGHD